MDVDLRTVASLYEWGLDALGRDLSYDVRLLLSSALNQPLSYIVAHSDELVSQSIIMTYQTMIKRRQAHEPVAYILGEVGFGPRLYSVVPDVLVPRPETELLVAAAVEMLPEQKDILVLECGVGTGVISCELGLARPQCQVHGWDINPLAIRNSQDNMVRHGVGNVSLHEGDFFDGVQQHNFAALAKPVLIVSNPPYIPSGDLENLDQTVRDYESTVALDGGETGLDFYDKLAMLMRGFLDRGIPVAMCCEIGIHQAPSLEVICERYALGTAQFDNDYAGIHRVVRIGIINP